MERCRISSLPAPRLRSELHHTGFPHHILKSASPGGLMQPAWCCRMLKSQWRRGTTRLHLERQKQCKLHGMLPEQTAALMSRDGMATVISAWF